MARVRANTRVLAIILALILAAVATVALLSYIRGVETRTQEEFEPVDAFVATAPISAGTSAEVAAAEGLIEERPVPRAAVPEGAITSLVDIQGAVATVDIAEGEVILVTRFGETVQAARGLGEIPEDKEAISVEVGVVPGVAGFISPGDQISVIAHLEVVGEVVDPDDEDAPEEIVGGGVRTQYLLQDVEVLAAGRRVIAEGEEQVQQTEQVLLTLAVDPVQAEQLVFAAIQGTLWFTLLPEEPEPDRPVDTPGRTIDNIFENLGP